MTNHRRQLITDLNSHLTKISRPYQCRKSLLSYGIYNSLLNLIEITSQHRSASKCFLSMGIIKNSKLYLYPEEAIFLMQCSLLQIFQNEKQTIPLALDEAYSLWFNQKSLTLKHLYVYQYLTRIGFILIRHRTDRKKEDLVNIIINKTNNKRKRNDEEELIERMEEQNEDTNHFICPIHLSTDCQRQWFPNYTDNPPIHMTHYPRLIFPDRFSPIHIDWFPSEYDSKVSNVQLSIYENKIFSPRPAYSLLRSIDLQSHQTIYQRLSSFIPPSIPSNQSSSNIFFDMYTPGKHFRKSQPDFPDYYLQIKNGNEQFDFNEIYHEQHTKVLTAIVHNGDICFYSFKTFDPIVALQ